MSFIPKMFLFLKISGHPVQGHSILQGSLISRKTKQHTVDREKKIDIQIFCGNLYGNRGCTAAMMHGRYKRFLFSREKFFHMQNTFIVTAMQHGCHAKTSIPLKIEIYYP